MAEEMWGVVAYGRWIRAAADWAIDVPIVDPLVGDFAGAAEDLAGNIG